MIKKSACIFMFCSFLAPQAYAADSDQTCKHFFDDVRNQINIVLGQQKTAAGQKQASLTVLFDKAVDTDWIGHYVAGDYWKTASEADRSAFLAAYRSYLSSHYVGGLDDNDLNDMKAIVVQEFKSVAANSFMVTTQVTRKSDEPMSIDLKLTEEPAGVCHVRDFTMEGVSQIQSQHEEIQ